MRPGGRRGRDRHLRLNCVVFRHCGGSSVLRLIRTRHIISDVSNDSADSTKLRPRVLGLDVGSKTIGMAVSDPLWITAQGLETLRRKNKRTDFAALNEIIRQYEVAEIVVGLPLRMSGNEGTQSEKMRLFAEDLRKSSK